MNIKQDIRPVTYLKTRAAAVLEQLNETHRPIIITQDGEPRAVMQDTQSFERMRAVVGLLKLLALGEMDIRKGKVVEQSRLFASTKAKLRKTRDA